MRSLVRGLSCLALLCLILPSLAVAAPGERGIILRCDKPYADVEQRVAALGGRVTHRFDNVDALAVVIPEGRIAELQALAGVKKLYKDAVVPAPTPVQDLKSLNGRPGGPVGVEAQSVQDLAPETLREVAAVPQDYAFNNDLIGATPLHAEGVFGDGVVVAVIDSGTANSPDVASIWGAVIGGETFVPAADDALSATSTGNGNHGTWVGSVIAGAALFGFFEESTLVQALLMHAPEAIWGTCEPGGVCTVPLIGVAPLADLYAMKVFPAQGGGAPESRIIAAMDRALTLKQNYDNGMPSAPVAGDGSEDNPYVYDSLNIQVVNMSLSGPTLAAGSDLEDELTRKMLKAGINVVASASNTGPSALTGGSPGTGEGSLTVGAASTAPHERVVRELQYSGIFGLGIGTVFRPFDGIQTATFSARGPTADGRIDPELTANGDWTFAEATDGGLWFVSGTSFSAPTAAGAAALLWEKFPHQKAGRIRNALYFGADPHVLDDKSGPIDQGRGFLDVEKAAKILQRHRRLPSRVARGVDSPWVGLNAARVGYPPIHFRHNRYHTRVENLMPGQASQLLVPVDKWTDQFTVTLSNVSPELPPAEQNQLFGDDVIVTIMDAPTSFDGYKLYEAFVAGDAAFPVDQPQTGIARVTVTGDWTNAGRISADVTIERTRSPRGMPTAWGRIAEGDLVPIEVKIPDASAEAVFDLAWVHHWGRFPTNDLDMILVPPVGDPVLAGATLASPERVVVENPAGGTWYVLVDGFLVNEGTHSHCRGHGNDKEMFSLRVTADGARIR